MRKNILAALLIASLLAACNTPQAPASTATPAQDAVATQVSLMLTNMPSATVVLNTSTPAPIPSATSLPPTPTSTQTQVPETPTQTPSGPTATVTQTLTPTLSSDDPKASLGQPSWQTSFDQANVFGTIENDNTKIHQENGALIMTGVNPNGWLGWSLTYVRQPVNFYVEATFTTGACSGKDQYGLMFRASNDSGYFFGVTCDGRYFLRANDFNSDVETNPIELSTGSSLAAGSNQTNRLGVLAKGEKISLYANGKLLSGVSDTTFKDKGYIGGFISAYETTNFTVNLEEISLWILD